MQTILLITTKNNWADEMDLEGIALFTPERWADHLHRIKVSFEKNQAPLTKCVGTNEEVEFYSFAEYEKQLTVKSISIDQALMYCQHLGMFINKLEKSNHYLFGGFGQLTLLEDDC